MPPTSTSEDTIMKPRTQLIAPLAAVALLAAACSSPAGLSRTSGEAASLSALDRTFIAQSAYGSLGEAALGRLAVTQAGSQGVRDFGRMMVEEHDRINAELITLATAKGVVPPSAPDPGRQAVSGMLAKLSGSAFDRQYVPQQLADHETELTLLRGEARYGQDADVRAFAERTAPIVERHITVLRQLLSNQSASAHAH
jgi:putative membrane protein